MMNGDCFTGNWGSLLGDFGLWGWIGLILNLIFWVGLIVGLTLLVISVIRRARSPASIATSASGQLTAKETLQARYARGEITRDQYQVIKQNIG